jgi:hypothetical protein
VTLREPLATLRDGALAAAGRLLGRPPRLTRALPRP